MWKTRFKSLARMATVCYMHSAISTNRRLYATATAPTARPANHMPNHTASTFFFLFSTQQTRSSEPVTTARTQQITYKTCDKSGKNVTHEGVTYTDLHTAHHTTVRR